VGRRRWLDERRACLKAAASLAAYDAAPPAEPLQWHEAPLRTEWGDGMMAADVELSKDETLTLYAHADALALVPAALAGAAPPTKRKRSRDSCDDRCRQHDNLGCRRGWAARSGCRV
jgi:hypothetical protein